ncbi:MAG: hypothetical protein U0Q15_09430 [Kineosporiaceae bacterium]
MDEAVDPDTGLALRVPEGWSARSAGPPSSRRLVLTAGAATAEAGSRLVAVSLPSDEDVRVAGPAAATVLVAGRSGRVVDYDLWDGDGRVVTFVTDGADAAPSIGRLWMVSRHGMLTTLTMLAPAAAWPAAQLAVDEALAGLRLPPGGWGAPLASSPAPARVDAHLAEWGHEREDLTALDDAQPRPLLGRRIGRAALAWLLRHPLDRPADPCPEVLHTVGDADEEHSLADRDEEPEEAAGDLAEDPHEDPYADPGDEAPGSARPAGSHPSALRADLVTAGLAEDDGGTALRPTSRGLLVAEVLQRCERRVHVEVEDADASAAAFVRVAGAELVLVTSQRAGGEAEGPGLRRARSLRLHVAPADALAVVLAGQVRLGPSWALPMPRLVVGADVLAARWADPRTPPPLPDPHLAEFWAQPWSLVTVRWSPGAAHARRSGRHARGGRRDGELRLLRAGRRGWLDAVPDGAGGVRLSVVAAWEVWRRLETIAAEVRGAP